MAVYPPDIFQISPPIGVTADCKSAEVRPTIKTTRVRDIRREEKRRLRKIRRPRDIRRDEHEPGISYMPFPSRVERAPACL